MHGKDGKLSTLFNWLDQDPHLDVEGGLVDRASMMQICLGTGLLLRDAHLIQFTEEEFSEDIPDHIVRSPWGASEYTKFQSYILKVRKDLCKDTETSRYVKFVAA